MYFIAGALLTCVFLGMIRFFNMFETVTEEVRTGVTALVLTTIFLWPLYLSIFGILLVISILALAAEYIGERL